MTDQKVMVVLNISLIFVSMLLLLNLFDIHPPTLGKAQLILNQDDPVCIGNYGDQYRSYDDLDICCFEANAKLSCSKESQFLLGEDTDYICETGFGDMSYYLNTKAYLYCGEQNFWTK